jgi:hypothetical protein
LNLGNQEFTDWAKVDANILQLAGRLHGAKVAEVAEFDDGMAVVALNLAVDLGLEGVVDGDNAFRAPVLVGSPDVKSSLGVRDVGLVSLKVLADPIWIRDRLGWWGRFGYFLSDNGRPRQYLPS